MKHRILSFITLLTLLIASAGCSSSDAPEKLPQNPQNTSQKPSATTVTATTAAAAKTTKPTPAVSGETSDTQAETSATSLYDYMLEKLAAYETVVRFSTEIPNETLDQTIKQILMDHPELFWIRQWYCTSTPSWSKLEIDTEASKDELSEMSDQLNAALQEIVDQVPDADAYGKALFVHDYIVNHTDYDQKSADDPETVKSTTAYDCLVRHKAVCSGYSRAYQLVMQQLGYPCGVCSGTSRGISHAWNYIQIEDKYYWADLTFDDPVSADGSSSDPDNIEHSYFLINDEMLLRTRTMGTDNLFVPVCDSLEQNYYVRHNAFLESYSPEDVNAILARSTGEHRVEIMFRTSDALQEAMTDLLNNEKIWELETVRSNSLTDLQYQSEPDMNVLILFF
ncbi:MAG: hypothetical protein IJ906_15330 [Oscillospiraceae bacterium]|nr:hypothetical protein [Oscillospiraceae bacterium]